MAQMNMIEAIRSALDVMMEKDPNVVILGEDVGYFGGVFRCTDGLQHKYGEHRVIDAPIAEGGIIGPIRIGDRGAVVARVETLRLIGSEEMASERDPVRARLLAERAQQLLIAIVNERRRDTVVTADDAFRQAFNRQG